MAAERAPSRRRQCIFHRTLLKSPFGQLCRKRRRSSSSYDVDHIESNQNPRERWSSLESSMGHPGDNAGSGQPSMPPNIEQPPKRSHGAQDENVFLEPDFMVNHELAPPNFRGQHGHLNMDLHRVSLDVTGQQEADSNYSSVSQIAEQTPSHISPPSPTVSSMEMDVGIDPETGERALD